MIAKAALSLVWLISFGALFSGDASALVLALRAIFCFLVVAHIVEAVVFRERIASAPGSRTAHLVQVFFFGMFHINELPELGAGGEG